MSGTSEDLKDAQCGFKIFKGDVARRLLPGIDRFMFDVEILYLAEEIWI